MTVSVRNKEFLFVINSVTRARTALWGAEGQKQFFPIRGEDLDRVVIPVTHNRVTIVCDRDFPGKLNMCRTEVSEEFSTFCE